MRCIRACASGAAWRGVLSVGRQAGETIELSIEAKTKSLVQLPLAAIGSRPSSERAESSLGPSDMCSGAVQLTCNLQRWQAERVGEWQAARWP